MLIGRVIGDVVATQKAPSHEGRKILVVQPLNLDGTERGKEFLLRTPMRRFGKVDELVGATVFLASDAASFVTGQVLAVDGGFLASGVNQ